METKEDEKKAEEEMSQEFWRKYDEDILQEKKEKVKEHWNKEAKVNREFDKIFPLGYAGTYPDYNMQHLEMNSILNYIKEGDKVMDLGCGKGYGALYMSWRKNINMIGIDYSKEMIEQAKLNLSKMKSLKGKTSFSVGDIMQDIFMQDFDVVYTERCLINITNWELQKKAIENISKLLKKGGLFIMQEGSQTSMDKLNEVRERYGLKPIKVVWHNLFFDDDKLIKYTKKYFDFIKMDNFSSMFTLLSRVINPALVYPEEPTYESKINKLALNMPNFGDYGYQKIYVFKKK